MLVLIHDRYAHPDSTVMGFAKIFNYASCFIVVLNLLSLFQVPLLLIVPIKLSVTAYITYVMLSMRLYI